jgi:hypothetical protein
VRRALPLLLALVPAACSSAEPPRFPQGCLTGVDGAQRALEAAPGDVRLGGFRISTCVRRAAPSDANLQAMGLLLTQVADDLGTRARVERSPELALRLGFLAGAVQRGTGDDSGVAVELGRRVGRSAFRLDEAPPEVREALERGLAAGRATG